MLFDTHAQLEEIFNNPKRYHFDPSKISQSLIDDPQLKNQVDSYAVLTCRHQPSSIPLGGFRPGYTQYVRTEPPQFVLTQFHYIWHVEGGGQLMTTTDVDNWPGEFYVTL